MEEVDEEGLKVVAVMMTTKAVAEGVVLEAGVVTMIMEKMADAEVALVEGEVVVVGLEVVAVTMKTEKMEMVVVLAVAEEPVVDLEVVVVTMTTKMVMVEDLVGVSEAVAVTMKTEKRVVMVEDLDAVVVTMGKAERMAKVSSCF